VPLALAGGAGVILYLAAWAVSAEPEPASERAQPPVSSVRQTVAIGLVVLGVLLLLRRAGIWLGDAWVWPAAIAVFGSAVIWTRGDEDVRERWVSIARRIPGLPERLVSRSVSPARVLLGGALIAAGMATFLAANDALPALRSLAFAVAVTLTGVGLILGPGMLGLARQLSEERRERIRSEERAEMAAHLHDSVLQTLALLQRSDSPQEMVRLARLQERELRSWLYGRGASEQRELLSAAVEEMAARVESLHDVTVETVVVGDQPLDDRLHTVVLACGEAATNAAKHSGADSVSVYVEVDPDAVTAYVRDEGKGFDPGAVPVERRGIAESIVGRMERSGGRAAVRSSSGVGTEIQLELPLGSR
jgi:signal transduction histidine kinase